MFIGQGANGILEGTPGNKPGIGRGDGVMVAGDVRTLARDFCASGTAVDYTQYDTLSHISTFPVWAPAALAWLNSRKPGTERLPAGPAGQFPGPGETSRLTLPPATGCPTAARSAQVRPELTARPGPPARTAPLPARRCPGPSGRC